MRVFLENSTWYSTISRLQLVSLQKIALPDGLLAVSNSHFLHDEAGTIRWKWTYITLPIQCGGC